jgi:hypothetical protein
MPSHLTSRAQPCSVGAGPGLASIGAMNLGSSSSRASGTKEGYAPTNEGRLVGSNRSRRTPLVWFGLILVVAEAGRGRRARGRRMRSCRRLRPRDRKRGSARRASAAVQASRLRKRWPAGSRRRRKSNRQRWVASADGCSHICRGEPDAGHA